MVSRCLRISAICVLILQQNPLVQKIDHAELASLSSETRPSELSFKAELKMHTILYVGASTDESDFVLNIYQNPDNIVRQELVGGPPSGGVGEGRDVHIIDYANETITTYDKGKSTAFRSKLRGADTVRPSPSAINLGEMTILGHRCTGFQDTIKYRGGTFVEIIETWSASEIAFKTPLLVISMALLSDGRLLSLSIRSVDNINTTSELDPGMFQVPSSYRIVDR